MKTKAKKSLGQNFLTSEQAVKDIVKTAEIKEGDFVIEIGPGKGVLTRALLRSGATVFAIEKDNALFGSLEKELDDAIKNKKLILENDDALNTNFSKKKSHKIVANIPYNITGTLLRKIFSEKNLPEKVVLMVQKEVAERIVARDGKESILSVSVKAYGDPRYIKTIKAGSFFPKPKVDSAILLIENISNKNWGKISEKEFFSIVKRGFSSKRKMLKKNLSCSSDILKQCGIKEDIRAEDLKLENWLCIAGEIQK